MSEERLVRYFNKEEQFLEEFDSGGVISAILGVIDRDAWRPEYDANDETRRKNEYTLKEGFFPDTFFFDGAALYHQGGQFSSVQVILKSSKRVVTIRVSRDENNELNAQKIVDKPL